MNKEQFDKLYENKDELFAALEAEETARAEEKAKAEEARAALEKERDTEKTRASTLEDLYRKAFGAPAKQSDGLEGEKEILSAFSARRR